MNKSIQEWVRWLLEHWVDAFIAIIFIIVLFCFYYFNVVFDDELQLQKDGVMPSLAALAMFLTWIQFVSNKKRQRKEAAITYYPRPTELEKIENEIDRVILFWSSSYSLQSYEVQLMLDKEVSDQEFELCWQRLSDKIKRKIVDIYAEYYCDSSKTSFFSSKNILKSLEYKSEYKSLIKEQFVDVRRKLNLYLNQIEGAVSNSECNT